MARHQKQPLRVIASKAVGYVSAVATAPLYLRGVTSVGERVRTVGRPRIVNFGSMHIGDDVILRSVNVPVELCTEAGAILRIGDGCSFNYGVSVGATLSIDIGNRVRLAPYVMVVDSEFHDIYDRSTRPKSRPVVIEDDVWVAAKAAILPGVRIGQGSVVGTASVVTRDVPPFTVVAGVPAKKIKELDPERFHK
ncbi:MAG: hypothetical protein A2289_15705 [Deltaproteobacteria bacterium RIFOXYA12_FULL_58_15]|nr:MAG: hypothetical protein A2289_15705 [Deltaproteobacteria bacterium RIFOXYA12_FULL_58_15]OGR14883.1 MAG: hypothetical protein A2341_18550 [Deltaproteobacteria bacterium RIFOXYB12_FULL_58_9]